MAKTGEDFRRQAETIGLTYWPVRRCSLCGYLLAYIFEGNTVRYDAGCYCVVYQRIEPRSWDEVADFYNMQSCPATVKEFDEFWSFVSEL